MKRLQKLILFFALPLIMVGCASAPPKKSFTLSPAENSVATGNRALPSLMVSQVKSIGRLSTDMTYSRSPNEIESYTKSDWVAPPAQLIQSLITQDLENRALFQYVVMAPNSVTAQNRLDITLLEMNQIFPNATDNHIVLKLQARLINNHNNKIIKTFTYNVTEPSRSYDAEGGVAAYNRALQKIADSLAADITQTLRRY